MRADRHEMGDRFIACRPAACRFFYIITKNFCYVNFRERARCRGMRAAGLKNFGAYVDRKTRPGSPASGPLNR